MDIHDCFALPSSGHSIYTMLLGQSEVGFNSVPGFKNSIASLTRSRTSASLMVSAIVENLRVEDHYPNCLGFGGAE